MPAALRHAVNANAAGCLSRVGWQTARIALERLHESAMLLCQSRLFVRFDSVLRQPFELEDAEISADELGVKTGGAAHLNHPIGRVRDRYRAVGTIRATGKGLIDS